MEATTAEDHAVGKALIEEYATALGVDLCFQNFSEEISNPPKIYPAALPCIALLGDRARFKIFGLR